MKQSQPPSRHVDLEPVPSAMPDVADAKGEPDSDDRLLQPADHVRDESDPASAPQSNPSGRRRWLVISGALVLVVGTIASWRWLQFQQTHPSTDNAQIKGHPSPIAPKISGRIQQVLVKDGDYVQAGQALVILEDQDLALKVQQAEASLAVANAQLQSATHTIPLTSETNQAQVQQSRANLAANLSAAGAAQATVAQMQATVKTNQAKVAQAQTEVNRTRVDWQRYETLYRQGAIAAQQRDTALAAYQSAVATLTAAQQTVAESQAAVSNAQAQSQKATAQVGVSQGQLAETQVAGQQVVVKQDDRAQAAAQVKQALANLALAKQQTEYTTITAPISGYVGNVTAQVGQRVQADQPFLSLVPLQLDQIYVEANFRETAIRNLRIGEPANVAVDAYPGETFRAAIAGISPATGANFALLPPDNATGNFNKVVQWVPIRLVFRPDADPQHKLRAGLSVKVTVDTTVASAQP